LASFKGNSDARTQKRPFARDFERIALVEGRRMGIIPRRRRAFSAVKFSPGPARNFAANDEDSYRRIDGSLMANRLADADLRVPPRKGAN